MIYSLVMKLLPYYGNLPAFQKLFRYVCNLYARRVVGTTSIFLLLSAIVRYSSVPPDISLQGVAFCCAMARIMKLKMSHAHLSALQGSSLSCLIQLISLLSRLINYAKKIQNYILLWFSIHDVPPLWFACCCLMAMIPLLSLAVYLN